MSNLNKQKTYFYTLFRNIPFTDEEWEHQTKHREKLLSDKRIAQTYKEKFPVLKNRPNHRWKWGSTGYSHEEAQAICEKALKAGAQHVEYGVSVFYGNAQEERWVYVKKTASWKRLK